jgi:hypothetical protein
MMVHEYLNSRNPNRKWIGCLSPYPPSGTFGGYDIAARVVRYERLRSQQMEAERQTEMLFQSLHPQSFSVGLCEEFK